MWVKSEETNNKFLVSPLNRRMGYSIVKGIYLGRKEVILTFSF